MNNRNLTQLYPDYSAECEELRNSGITPALLYRIINKHKPNALYNRKLYERYMCLNKAVPIMERTPRFEEEKPVNNKINNDFFGEIVDFKTGYFAGKPIAYGYSRGDESEEVTGGSENVEKAVKLVTDFTARNNMYGVDMEITKLASIYGYAGRLFYIDTQGMERVMPLHGYETIVLSQTDITEPEYSVRYYSTPTAAGSRVWTAEFYDSETITVYKGSLNDLRFVETRPHMFDYCPLQGIPNNKEMLGDAEKVIALIDDYDKVLSDNSNEVENFVHAYMVIENLNIQNDDLAKGKASGSFQLRQIGTQEGKIYYLTKDINDAFTEHHLERLEKNIYRFTKTPNLNDESFGSASGVSLKFKLHGLETKCGMYQAQLMNAAQFMWRLLASSWNKRGNKIDPLQITMDFKRNFPLDTLSEAQTAQALIAAGIPKRVAYSQISFVDDVEYVMQQIEDEQDNIPELDNISDYEEE